MGTEPEGHTLEALIDELARVLHGEGEARELARRAGFPVADLPAFDTARVFWSRVVHAANDGKTVGGVGAIVALAKARFPGNRFFAAYGSTTTATAAESMPPEPRLGAAVDNRSASIGQQIVVYGNPTFGAMTVGVPAPGGPSSGPATAPPTQDFPEYRRLARAQHQHLRLVGFDERVKVAIELRDLYVELDVVLDHGTLERMVYGDAHHAKAHAEQYARCERIVMAEAFARAKAYGKRGLVLLGDPGSGKTTQLRRVLLQVLSTPEDGGGPEVLGLPADTLPVFLPLRSLAGHAWPRTLVELLARVLSGPAGRSMTELAQALVDRGNLLLLFDGLDEVADEAHRDEVARWLEALLFDRPDCWFLVSSRYAGYTPTVKLEADFLELHLRPLTDEQAQRFVENWYRVVEVAEAERDGRAPGPGRAAELLEELQGLERRGEAQIYAMIRNPLLLTAICLVHRRAEGALPAGREALYRECTRVLLEGWRKRGKQLPVVLPAEQATQVLQPVALWMHGEDGRTQASAAELAGPVATGFQSIGRPGVDASELLRRIRDESGLLTGWGLDRYGFMHLGFQEYLAALELRRRGAEGRGREAVDGLRALAGRFGETWWREVMRGRSRP